MQYETLFQELENSTEIIRTLLARVNQEEARIKPNPESWSMLEIVCHLFDEEREDFREHLDLALNWNQGVTRIASKEWSKALPRRRILWTNSKKPRYQGNFSCEIPR